MGYFVVCSPMLQFGDAMKHLIGWGFLFVFKIASIDPVIIGKPCKHNGRPVGQFDLFESCRNVCEERDRMILIVGFFYGSHGHSLREKWKCP
ncbi:MAG: hypothetical protein BGP19_05250 [Thiobacillus sp. 0-1251]|nr:MAG: hypothetical protein BGP19_05250 [Thiobacillus sp. 0-1251]